MMMSARSSGTQGFLLRTSVSEQGTISGRPVFDELISQEGPPTASSYNVKPSEYTSLRASQNLATVQEPCIAGYQSHLRRG